MVNKDNEKFLLINDICKFLDRAFPHELAWDEDLPRIGFILGDKLSKINNILLSLDINDEVVEEAIKNGVNLIITHHPLIYNPIYKIDYNTSEGNVLKKLILNNISVYAMHTNFDVGIGGIADFLAKQLSLKNITGDNLKNSYVRYGEVEPKTFREFIEFVKEKFKLEGLRYAGDEKKLINTVGILGGSGGSESDVRQAITNKVNLYISSEFKLNAVQYAINNNLCIIEVNHGVEKLAINNLKFKLMKRVPNEIFISAIETDPFKYYI